MFDINNDIKNNNPQHLNQNNILSEYQSRKIDIALISAMPEELEFFKEKFSNRKKQILTIKGFEFAICEYNNVRILVAHTGLGTAFAASALAFIDSYFHPEYVLLSGTAGGIKDNIKINDVVIVDKSFEAEIQNVFHLVKHTPFETCLKHPFNHQTFPSIYQANNELLDIAKSIQSLDTKIYIGTAATSNVFPSPKELYEKIKLHNPYCIDMETSALYQTAWLLNIKTLAVRGISNMLNEDGTDENIHLSNLKDSSNNAAAIVFKILEKLSMKFLKANRNSEKQSNDVVTLINRYHLEPHAEGGLFAPIYKSQSEVTPDASRYLGEKRSACTSIYYLLDKCDFSAWHCLKSDEIWHYYCGSAVKIHIMDKFGNLTTHLLGDPLKIHSATFQICIPADNWFAAENIDKHSYSFVGCTVSPGFEYCDFILADRKQLIDRFPQHQSIIEKFTHHSCENKSDYKVS